LNRGKNKKRLEDYHAAIEDFEKAIRTKGGESIYMAKVENPFVETGFEFDVGMEEIRFERGIARYKIDSLRTAFDDFNFCIQKNFELPASYYWRGLIYLAYGKKTEACTDLKKSQELGDSDAHEIIANKGFSGMRRVVARFNFSCNLIGNRPQSLTGHIVNR
jgi:tetratricopeptide (TPR) repeat protein